MTSIPAPICRIYRKNFKRHYLRNKKLFLYFLLHFWNVHEIWSIFEKKHEYVSLNISEIIYAERRGYLNIQKVFLQNTIRYWTC